MTRGLPAILALVCCSCALQAGPYAGAVTRVHSEQRRAALSWGGQLRPSATLRVLGQRWQLSGTLEGRAQEPEGGLALWGVQLGPTLRLSRRVDFVPALDFGVPIGFSDRVRGGYAGLSVELPIAMKSERDITSINHDYRFVDQDIALVPFVHLRYYDLNAGQHDRERGFELAAGIAFRARLVSDLIEL